MFRFVFGGFQVCFIEMPRFSLLLVCIPISIPFAVKMNPLDAFFDSVLFSRAAIGFPIVYCT